MNDFHHHPSPACQQNAPLADGPAKPAGQNTRSAARRLFTAFLTLAALAGPATGADITATPPAGGGFVVTNADQSAERLRVNEDGSVTIPGAVQMGSAQAANVVVNGTAQLNGAAVVNSVKAPAYTDPLGNILVCLNTTTGKLARCSQWSTFSPAGGGAIYVKKASFAVNTDFPVQTYVAQCDAPSDKVLGGVAYMVGGYSIVKSVDYEDYTLRVVADTRDVDTLNTTITCMRTQ